MTLTEVNCSYIFLVGEELNAVKRVQWLVVLVNNKAQSRNKAITVPDRRCLVGVFEEKARLLQWLVFCHFNAIGSFVQLLGWLIFWGLRKQERVGSSLALNHKFFMLPKVEEKPKGLPFNLRDFSGTMRLFSENV